MSQTKSLLGWVEEAKKLYRELTEDWQILLGIISVVIIIAGSAGSVVGILFGFSLKAFIAGISVLLVTGINVISLIICFEKFDTLNPIKIWQKLFWYEVDFSKSRAMNEVLEDWFDTNCTGRWTSTDGFYKFRFSKKEDAIHAKLVWQEV